MDSYIAHKIQLDDEIDLANQKPKNFVKSLKKSDINYTDDSYHYEGGSSDDDDDDEPDKPDDFMEEIKEKKKELKWAALRQYIIGFLIAAAMFGGFFGAVSSQRVQIDNSEEFKQPAA